MGFFATFWGWLNGQLVTYIGTQTARIAAALEPAVVTLATVYVMSWGYLQLTGRIDEPLTAGLRRLVTLAVVLGAALHLWLYNSLLVDTFYRAPAQLAAAVVGSSDPVSLLDDIWTQGGAVADTLWNNGGVFSGDFGYYIAGAVVWALIGLLCVYTMFLIALSSIALAVLLALGPLFLAMLLFEATQRFFAAWLAQLANYALITVLTVLVAALLLQVVANYAQQTAARGTALLTVDALDLLLVAVLVFLLLRQILPIAAALAGGVALSSFGAMSRAVSWGLSSATRGAALLASVPRSTSATVTSLPATWRTSLHVH
ncbi:MAG: type IV secretion system protein [Gammaproteobacteria bacterium]|nr:type IV secretion system protein [Gammaproteobacteria bacterium]MBV9619645.1 type IV secretion system protein [Gammaproteobacteria bacterium]